MEGRTVRHLTTLTGALVGALLLTSPAPAMSDDEGTARANDPVSLQHAPTFVSEPSPVTTPAAIEVPPAVAPSPSSPPAAVAASGASFESRRLGAVAELEPAETTVEAAANWFDPRENEIIRVGLALSGVLVLMLIVRGVVGRASGLAGGGRPSGVVEIIARYPVARGQSIVLLKLARRIVLVHQTGSTMTTLSETADPEEVAGILGRIEASKRSPRGDRFPSLLGRAERAHRTAEQKLLSNRPVDTIDGIEVVDLTRGGSTRPETGRASRQRQRSLAPEGVTA